MMNLQLLKGGLIVSCQALDGEPLHSSFIMGRMAVAAMQGGAVGIRANSVKDINEIKQQVDLPVLGIIKRDYPGSEIYITATQKEVRELLETDAEVIALDATNRVRPNNEQARNLVKIIHDAGRLAMADISNYAEGLTALKEGFDLISTTMSGYTSYTKIRDEPDFSLVAALTQNLKIPIIMEGHTRNPRDMGKGFSLGAFAVVVGGAITRPQQITQKFVRYLN